MGEEGERYLLCSCCGGHKNSSFEEARVHEIKLIDQHFRLHDEANLGRAQMEAIQGIRERTSNELTISPPCWTDSRFQICYFRDLN